MSIPRVHPPSWKVALGLSVLYFVWGSTYLAIRVAVAHMPPATLAGTRFVAAGLVMLALSLHRREPAPKRRAEWATPALVGVLLLLCGNGLVCWAEQYVTSGLTALVICSTPLWLLSMESLVPGGERISGFDAVCLLAGLGGIGILVSPQLAAGPGASAAGVLALLGAAICWALGSTIARHAPMPSSIWVLSAIEMLCGGSALLFAAWASGELGRFRAADVPAVAWLAWSYLFVFGSLLGFSTYNWMIANVRPSLVTTYAYVNPVVAVALGVVILGEPLGRSTLVGAAVTLAAVAAVTRRKAGRSQRTG